jgi:hypothetical protein
MQRIFIVIVLILFLSKTSAAQPSGPVVLMDFVKIKEGKKAEAMYFYENNWKLYRDIAVKKKVIKSYQLMKVIPDSLNNFDLILITSYTDTAQFLKSEENFRQIIDETRPNGPALLNHLKPADFRQNVFFKATQSVSSKKRIENE